MSHAIVFFHTIPYPLSHYHIIFHFISCSLSSAILPHSSPSILPYLRYRRAATRSLRHDIRHIPAARQRVRARADGPLCVQPGTHTTPHRTTTACYPPIALHLIDCTVYVQSVFVYLPPPPSFIYSPLFFLFASFSSPLLSSLLFFSTPRRPILRDRTLRLCVAVWLLIPD